jgi:hypothetical protein
MSLDWLASVGMPSFSYATASFSSPGVPALLCRTFPVSHVFSEDAVRRDHGLSLADLARGRLRLDRLSRNGVGETFFPWASPIPREARKSHRRHPPLRSGPRAGASSIASGLQIAIEAAMVAGSNSKGEVTWLTSVPSRSPATSTRATS